MNPSAPIGSLLTIGCCWGHERGVNRFFANNCERPVVWAAFRERTFEVVECSTDTRWSAPQKLDTKLLGFTLVMRQKKERHASVPLWMFTQRNNPYCVYPSNFVGAKVVLFYEITKYFRKNLYISCIFCNFAAKLESLCPSLFIEILIKQRVRYARIL